MAKLKVTFQVEENYVFLFCIFVVADDLVLGADAEKDGETETTSHLTPRKQVPKKRGVSTRC
jgi:hypothetical protein